MVRPGLYQNRPIALCVGSRSLGGLITTSGAVMSKHMKTWGIVLLLAAIGVVSVLALLGMGKRLVESQIRGDLVAGALLTRIQLTGERMRRFEKEMFIYVTVPARRAAYEKQFDEAYQDMLVDLDTALAPSGRAFDDTERAEILRWKASSITYVAAFNQLQGAAALLDQPESARGAPLRTTQDFNMAIEEGKNAFRVLLSGTEQMRTRRKTDAAAIAAEIERGLVGITVAAAVLFGLVGGFIVMTLRRRPGLQAIPRGRAAGAPTAA